MSGNNKRFDLIVLDINMPVSDGWDAIKNIKRLYMNDLLLKSNKQKEYEH